MRDCRPRRFATAFLCAAALAGCVHPDVEPEPPPPAPAPFAFSEEALPRAARARIEVVDFQDRPTPDKKRVIVSGTLINRGYASTLELRVTITARDKNDQIIDQVEAVASNEQVPPGDTTKFSATMPNRPEVVRYQVQALAR